MAASYATSVFATPGPVGSAFLPSNFWQVMGSMNDKNIWETFFDSHAPDYMRNDFTRNTFVEVGFILSELDPPTGGHILDMGCGTGRHAIELARRGYCVTGVDISAGMLAEARKAAQAAGLTVEWVKADATQFQAAHLYDAAVCLCEGAFSLLGLDDDPIEHDLAILRNVFAALKPGGGFLLTAINGMRPIRLYAQEDVAKGTFDPLWLVETTTMTLDTPEGTKTFRVRERGYVPTELGLLFRVVGFEVEHIGGGTAGRWGRRVPDLDEMELMVIAIKPASV